MSLARRHRERILAGVLAGGALSSIAAANDNTAPAAPTEGEPAAAYLQQLANLAAHKRQLKSLQSLERKIALKREIVGGYDPWVEGALAAGDAGHAVQDEVLATMMVWRIDIGDFAQALRIGRHVLKHNIGLPERFERGAACLLVEEIAEAAVRVHDDPEASFATELLDELAELSAGRDMPDEVQAKLFKARGVATVRRAEQLDANTPIAGLRPALLAAALEHFRRAYALNSKAGVKTEISRLEKALQKEDPMTIASDRRRAIMTDRDATRPGGVLPAAERLAQDPRVGGPGAANMGTVTTDDTEPPQNTDTDGDGERNVGPDLAHTDSFGAPTE